MERVFVRSTLLAVLSSALGWSACVEGAEPEPDQRSIAGAQSRAGDVAVITQALGGFTDLWVGNSAQSPLDLGGTFAIFKSSSGGCDQPVVVRTQTGDEVDVDPLPSCPSIYAAGGDSSAMFLADSASGTLYASQMQPIGGSGGGGGMAWIPITTAVVDYAVKVLVSGTYVYWQDDLGIRRVHTYGGTVQLLATNAVLLGIDGASLYFQTVSAVPPVSFSLKKMPVGGGTPTPLRTESVGFAPGFTFDANYFYWIEGSGINGTTHRLRRLTKSGSTISTLYSSTTLKYQSPISDSTALWWREQDIATGTATIRRRNHASGQLDIAPFPTLTVSGMRLAPDSIYVTGLVANSPATYALQLTSR